MNSSYLIAAALLAGTLAPLQAQQKSALALDASLRPKAIKSIEKGLKFLADKQDPKGYWSSTEYPGLSALIVQAFLLAPDDVNTSSKPVKKGLDYIRDNAKDDGGIYNKGMGNYNTSLALAALVRAEVKRDKGLIEDARRYLAKAQNKTGKNSDDNGGFGYEPEGQRSRPDLDNTIFALEAMALYKEQFPADEGLDDSGLDWQAAIDFVSSCQNLKATNDADWASDDPADRGGFTYTPNGASGGGTHSYGSMSYAGLLSLIYADVDADDQRVKAALEWLSEHYTLEENPGQGKEGLYYYYYVMAKALSAAGLETLPTKSGGKIKWREELVNKLLSLQQKDGSWSNANGRWMEKDPVLVTGYVVLALSAITGEK